MSARALKIGQMYLFRTSGRRLDASHSRDTEVERFVLNNATDCVTSHSFGAGVLKTGKQSSEEIKDNHGDRNNDI